MITLLAKIFVKEEMPEEKRRTTYGRICGIVGIFLNLVLFAGKLFAGIISHSIAIIADAINNLSDAGSSIVTLVGFSLSEQKPDSEHPFGHGRIEYVSGLIVSAVILIMAAELIRDSVAKILNPVDTEFSALLFIILGASILVKCYMAFYNYRVGKKIGSATLKAVMTDSLSDCITTSVVILAMVVERVWGLRVDGYSGVIVGLLIFYAGLSAAKQTIDPLLGQAPDPEFVQKIADKIIGFDVSISGYHDLIVHDYGPGRRFISFHVEVPANGSIVELHDVVDRLEKELEKELGCVVTVHLDPMEEDNEQVAATKAELKSIVKGINEALSFHEFRMTHCEDKILLVFDLVIPFAVKIPENIIIEEIQAQVTKQLGERYELRMIVDRAEVL